MIKIKELKKNRHELNRKVYEAKSLLTILVDEVKSADVNERQVILTKVLEVNEEINRFSAKSFLISEEIASRTKLAGKKKVKKVRKIHNVSGRSIDPTGFKGIVSGGAPGGGKRR